MPFKIQNAVSPNCLLPHKGAKHGLFQAKDQTYEERQYHKVILLFCFWKTVEQISVKVKIYLKSKIIFSLQDFFRLFFFLIIIWMQLVCHSSYFMTFLPCSLSKWR